jgi:hypothetical protein
VTLGEGLASVTLPIVTIEVYNPDEDAPDHDYRRRALADPTLTCQFSAPPDACESCSDLRDLFLRIGSAEWAAIDRGEHTCDRGPECECACVLIYRRRDPSWPEGYECYEP